MWNLLHIAQRSCEGCRNNLLTKFYSFAKESARLQRPLNFGIESDQCREALIVLLLSRSQAV